jgi:uncharacterized phage infection (PIP) family protein YhgE
MALALTGMALLALAGQEVFPQGSWRFWQSPPAMTAGGPEALARTPGTPAKTDVTANSADLLAALTAHDHGALRDQIAAIRTLLSPASGDPDMVAISQARARLAALAAAQDQSAPQPAAVLGQFLSHIDAQMTALRDTSAREASVVAPPLAIDDTLLKVAVVLALFAAVLALASGPLALAPVQMLCAGLADAALDIAQGIGAPHSLSQAKSRMERLWGVERADTWGLLARHAANLLNAGPTHRVVAASAPTEELRQTAEAMSRLLLDSGQELARLRGETGEAVNNAVMLGARLADAVLDAEARLEARVQRSLPSRDPHLDAPDASNHQGGFVDTAALWSAAAAHADRLEEAATRALAVATVLPAAADRIETAIAGLDRMAVSVAANSDGLADLAARAGAAAAMLPEAAQRIEQAANGLDSVTHRTSSAAAMLPQAAQLIAQASAELGRAAEAVNANATGLNDAVARQAEIASSLPHVARRIETAVAGLDRTTAALDEASDHARIANRAAAAAASSTETSQRALNDAAQHIASLGASLGEQLPTLAYQLADTTEGLRGGATTILQAAERVEGTSRAIATLSSGAEAAQSAMASATFRMTSISDQLPAVALQIANASSELEQSAGYVARSADRAEETSRAIVALTTGVETAHSGLSSAMQRMSSLGEELPALAFQIAEATNGLDNSAMAVQQAAHTVSECTSAQFGTIENLKQVMNETLPAIAQRMEGGASQLDQSNQTIAAQALRIEAVSEALEHRANGLDQVAERMAEKVDEAARMQESTDARQASLAETVRQIAGLATTIGDHLPPLAGRISNAVALLEESAGSLSMIGASAGEALPAAASRIDEALAGLDSTVQLISEAARTAAASLAESAGTQSALAQTVQCMASVGEALPSLAMRLEGTLGALDRSTDTIVAAANDVAEAGRALSANANGTGTGDEEGERRPSFGPPRPVPDASMRRLQSVQSALAMAGNGSRG